MCFVNKEKYTYTKNLYQAKCFVSGLSMSNVHLTKYVDKISYYTTNPSQWKHSNDVSSHSMAFKAKLNVNKM